MTTDLGPDDGGLVRPSGGPGTAARRHHVRQRGGARTPAGLGRGRLVHPAETSDLLARYEDFVEPVNTVIKAMPAERLFKWALRDRSPRQQCSVGRVSLLGDAAHAMLPFLGQGTNMAIEDGTVLGRCFAVAADVEEALARYEAARKERANGVQIGSRARAEVLDVSARVVGPGVPDSERAGEGGKKRRGSPRRPDRWRDDGPMRRSMAATGAAIFFGLAPGVVAGLVPWWLTGWRLREPLTYWMPVRILGIALTAAGFAVLVHAFARFVVEGMGTPAPVAPTAKLVVGGLYRHVRNPMYLAVTATIVGQALLMWQPVLLLYAVIVCAAFVAFVLGYEQPALRRRFGSEYEAYRRAVPGWRPRLRPWRPDASSR